MGREGGGAPFPLMVLSVMRCFLLPLPRATTCQSIHHRMLQTLPPSRVMVWTASCLPNLSVPSECWERRGPHPAKQMTKIEIPGNPLGSTTL